MPDSDTCDLLCLDLAKAERLRHERLDLEPLPPGSPTSARRSRIRRG